MVDHRHRPYTLWFAKESDNHFHRCSGEHFRVVFIPYGTQGLPYAACLVHLAAEKAQGAIVVVVGVIQKPHCP